VLHADTARLSVIPGGGVVLASAVHFQLVMVGVEPSVALAVYNTESPTTGAVGVGPPETASWRRELESGTIEYSTPT